VIESSAIIDVTFQPHEHVDVHQLFISIKKKKKDASCPMKRGNECGNQETQIQ